jgi:general secretion pathway protein B
MSYILEALRKSEQERERDRGEVPDIKSVHTSYNTSETPGRHKAWWWLLAGVVLINGVIFAVVYVGEDETTIAQAPSQLLPPSAQTVPDNNPRETARGSSSAPAKETENSTPQNPVRQEPSAVASESSNQSTPRVVFSEEPLQLDDSAGDQSSVTVDVTDKSGAQAVEESTADAGPVSDLPDNVRKQIPSIAFGGHIYSSSVQRRSVMINGKKRREGEVIESGLVLSAITPAGAEFEFQGYRFRLNALQDWSYQ